MTSEGNDVYREWERLLRQGKRLTEEQRERFTMLTLSQLRKDISQLKDDVKTIKEMETRIEILERYSIFMFAQKHPKWATAILILFLIFFLVFEQEFGLFVVLVFV